MAYLELFPDSFFKLQEEMLKDQACLTYVVLALVDQTNPGIEEKLAAVAAYLNILVHGSYILDDLCLMLITKLQEKNAIQLS